MNILLILVLVAIVVAVAVFAMKPRKAAASPCNVCPKKNMSN
jgi:hypothetical protein